MQRTHISSQKPEFVLRRAVELINSATGNGDTEKGLALEQLHSVISNSAKRKGQVWTKSFEAIIKFHLELCVDLKDYRTAKDGLHQYRNLCQAVDPNSLEIAILHLMDLAETRTAAAKQKADRVALAAAAKISDLDVEETPESIMLSGMTEEGTKERTDREVVVPWLRFLWEIYRAVLELLYKNAKLEKVYHKTCEKAFNFCTEYNRNLEFRRLCEMLRQHLEQLQKMAGAVNNKNRVVWEWTPESVEMQLQTRFYQLEKATSLELWNEGFRTVADIYAIMLLGKKTPKPRLMSVYYEKLQRIFWVSENYLFHAFSCYRYYALTCESRKDLKQEDKSLMASTVLLAALSIPSIKDSTDSSALSLLDEYDDDETATEKNIQLATLLDFQTNPTRKALLNDIVAKGVLQDVIPELQGLYDILETKFHPLKLASSLVTVIKAIKSHPQLAVYALPLQRVAVLRVVQQLSRVYSNLRIDFVRNLLSCLPDISYNSIEKIMIDGVARKQLQLRIDHREGCMRFSTPTVTASAVENQVTQLGINLKKIASKLAKQLGSADLEVKETSARQEFLRKVAESVEEDRKIIFDRHVMIEQRKQYLEYLHSKKKEQATLDAANLILEQQQQQIALEQQEAKRREDERKKKEKEAEEISKLKRELASHNVIKDEATLASLSPEERSKLLEKARMDSAKAKAEEDRRVNEQANRLDHITRALRMEAAVKVPQKYSEQKEADYKAYVLKCEEFTKDFKAKHEQNLIEKARLSKMFNLRLPFEQEQLLPKQKQLYENSLLVARKNAIEEHRQAKIENARRLFDEDMRRIEEEERIERERIDAENKIRDEEIRLERERIHKEEENRLAAERAEKIRRQREDDEARQRARELENEKRKKEEDADLKRLVTDPIARRNEAPEEDKWGRRNDPIRDEVPRQSAADVEDKWGKAKPEAVPFKKSQADDEDKWRGSRAEGPSSAKRPPPAAERAPAAEPWRNSRTDAPKRDEGSWGREAPKKDDDKWGASRSDKKDEGSWGRTSSKKDSNNSSGNNGAPTNSRGNSRW